MGILIDVINKEEQLWQIPKYCGRTVGASNHPALTISYPKVPFLNKSCWSQGVKAKVFATQRGLYMHPTKLILPNDRIQLVFFSKYLSGLASGCPQPTTCYLFNQTPMDYRKFTRKFESMILGDEKTTKAKTALQVSAFTLNKLT